MKVEKIAFGLLVVAAVAGCQQPSPGAKTEFVIQNRSQRNLFLQPVAQSLAANPMDLSKVKKDDKVKLFADAEKLRNMGVSYNLLVVEKMGDVDATLVGYIRLSRAEIDYAEKNGPVKVSLEPNKIFVKFGKRTKMYDYLAKPKIGGEILPTPPAVKVEKK